MSDTPRADAEIKRTARIGAMSGMDQAWEDMCHFAREIERELSQPRAVPDIPTEAMWNGLARDIVMWMDMAERKTPATLFEHLSRLGTDIPQWLRDEAEMQNPHHTISKGTRAVIIYRAMLSAAPQPPVERSYDDGYSSGKIDGYGEGVISVMGEIDRVNTVLTMFDNAREEFAAAMEQVKKWKERPPVERDGEMVPVRRDVIEFLRGAGEIDGTWFGEGSEHPPYWWRKYLPAAPLEREAGK